MDSVPVLSTAVHSIVTIKQDEDKIVPIDSHKVFCLSGEAGDRVQFSEFIIANVKLYALTNSTELTTKSVANYTRGEMAKALRKVSQGQTGEDGKGTQKGGTGTRRGGMAKALRKVKQQRCITWRAEGFSS